MLTLVMRVDFPQGAGFDEAQIRAALDLGLDGGTARSSSKETVPRVDVKADGYLGREMIAQIEPHFIVSRIFYVPGYIYLVTVVSRSSKGDPLVDRTLNSLKFLRPRGPA